MISFKLLSASIVLLISLVSGLYPFLKRLKNKNHLNIPKGEAFASGIFLGAGLIHMLGESSRDFIAMGVDYPLPFLIAGVVFLGFLLLEHVAKELYHHADQSKSAFAVVAFIMLSIHGFLAGTALGITSSLSLAIVVFAAILAHKWAESFALALQLTKSPLRFAIALTLFIIFTLMTPLGIFLGSYSLESLEHLHFIEPTFLALAAGTFLYLGSLHGLEKSVLISECCNLSVFLYVIAGFSLMALIGLWI
ncbi:MAG: ZIP family metal transporter [Cellvibrionales bacterium]|nr:ZIP family metal transporter [Cellvibrionales bacterium]